MFVLADTEERCVLVTVYYVDISTSVSLGDILEIRRPVYRLMNIDWRKEVRGRVDRSSLLYSCVFSVEILHSIVTC